MSDAPFLAYRTLTNGNVESLMVVPTSVVSARDAEIERLKTDLHIAETFFEGHEEELKTLRPQLTAAQQQLREIDLATPRAEGESILVGVQEMYSELQSALRNRSELQDQLAKAESAAQKATEVGLETAEKLTLAWQELDDLRAKLAVANLRLATRGE